MKGLICPNCRKELRFEKVIDFDNYKYDKWICEDCSHIIILDWRDVNDN